MPLSPATPIRERRWYQYSLRSLFMLVIVASALAAAASAFGEWGAILVLALVGLTLIGIAGCRRQAPLGIIGCLLLAIPVFCLLIPKVAWIGSRNIPLELRVVDAKTGAPVGGATIQMIDNYGSLGSQSQTGLDGAAVVTTRFITAGEDDLFKKAGAIYLSRHSLSVMAKGYAPLIEPLESYTGPTWNLYGRPLPPITVRLTSVSAIAPNSDGTVVRGTH